ncbi:IS4 family transposase [Amycolatopsis plumensis]|uniref:IS4 family transposase n=1 Tax=Amycolatopsis plumensis TaxID=236508 RepID=UPI003618C5AF
MSGIGGGWADSMSVGVLATAVPRDAVDTAIAVTRRGAKRSGGKLPPHVMVYYAMALSLFADDDYEEVMTCLAGTLASWGCWDPGWDIPTTGGITQARQRLGAEPLAEVFDTVAVPVADELTQGAFLGPWRLMSIDGFEWDAPDTDANVAEFGYSGGTGEKASAFAKVRVLTIAECASHAVVATRIGGRGTGGKRQGEQTLARRLWPALAEDWLLIADSGFYSYQDWSKAAATGAALLWRLPATVKTPKLMDLDDGSYLSVLINKTVRSTTRRAEILQTARDGGDLDPAEATVVRVIEYTVPDRGPDPDEVIRVITTIGDPADAPAEILAQAYHQRWEHETGNDQLKTHLRGPGRVLRSKSPDMIRQEIYGYLLTHYAISTLICRAATEADIDPDRVKFLRTVRLVRRQTTSGPAAFSP